MSNDAGIQENVWAALVESARQEVDKLSVLYGSADMPKTALEAHAEFAPSLAIQATANPMTIQSSATVPTFNLRSTFSLNDQQRIQPDGEAAKSLVLAAAKNYASALDVVLANGIDILGKPISPPGKNYPSNCTIVGQQFSGLSRGAPIRTADFAGVAGKKRCDQVIVDFADALQVLRANSHFETPIALVGVGLASVLNQYRRSGTVRQHVANSIGRQPIVSPCVEDGCGLLIAPGAQAIDVATAQHAVLVVERIAPLTLSISGNYALRIREASALQVVSYTNI